MDWFHAYSVLCTKVPWTNSIHFNLGTNMEIIVLMFLKLSEFQPMLDGFMALYSHSTARNIVNWLFCASVLEILLMDFNEDKIHLTEYFWMKSVNCAALLMFCSETSCGMLLGEAAQTGLMCSALGKRNQMVLVFFFPWVSNGKSDQHLTEKKNEVTLIWNTSF